MDRPRNQNRANTDSVFMNFGWWARETYDQLTIPTLLSWATRRRA